MVLQVQSSPQNEVLDGWHVRATSADDLPQEVPSSASRLFWGKVKAKLAIHFESLEPRLSSILVHHGRNKVHRCVRAERLFRFRTWTDATLLDRSDDQVHLYFSWS